MDVNLTKFKENCYPLSLGFVRRGRDNDLKFSAIRQQSGPKQRLIYAPSTIEVILVISNFPDENIARLVAERLVTTRLAACANILAPCRSIYAWQGKIEDTSEYPVLIKTTTDRYAAVEALIKEMHPYELPEIIALPVELGLPQYLAWVANETKPMKL